MLQRLRVLQVSLASARPLCLLPGLYLSDAVGASSMHTLRHLGITHILNATEVRRRGPVEWGGSFQGKGGVADGDPGPPAAMSAIPPAPRPPL